MFHRFASVLFGDELEEVSVCRPGQQTFVHQEEEEDDEEWILVDYLAEACSRSCSDGLTGLAGASEQEDEEDDLVMVPSPVASPPLRYASCTSLNSTCDTDADGGPEEDEEEDEEEEEGGFLQLQACSMEESWFVTPPPCFTGSRGSQPLLLEPSPLEDLLIEHPSMSVYAASRPRSPLGRGRDLSLSAVKTAAAAEAGRRSLDLPCHRPDVAVVQRRSSLHPSCYAAAALSGRPGLVEQAGQAGLLAPRAQPPSRKALRRLNLLRHPGATKQAKTTAMYLHQPGQKHLNY